VLAQRISIFLFFFVNEMLFLNIGSGSFPLSAILPANIEILWASTREAYNFIQAKQLSCNIITMPPKIINQIQVFGRSSKSMTLDTVKGFLKDSKKSNFSL